VTDVAPRTTVAFVAGWGRSGSTLLGRLLATPPDVVDAGELFLLWTHGDLGRRCACGALLGDCPQWAPVVDSVAASRGGSWADIVDAQHHRYRTGLRTRALWRATSSHPPAEARAFGKVTTSVAKALAATTGVKVVVDTSKVAGALVGSLADPMAEVRIVHLVRDPRGVAASWGRQVSHAGGGRLAEHGAARSAIEWVARNVAVGVVARRRDVPRLFVTYDELIGAPHHTLARVRAFLDLPPESAPIVDGVAVFEPSHAIGGNPARSAAGDVPLVADERWRAELDRWERVVVTAVAGPWWWAWRRRARSFSS